MLLLVLEERCDFLDFFDRPPLVAVDAFDSTALLLVLGCCRCSSTNNLLFDNFVVSVMVGGDGDGDGATLFLALAEEDLLLLLPPADTEDEFELEGDAAERLMILSACLP